MHRREQKLARISLTTGQQAAWHGLSGAVPPAVSTVEQLQQWALARRAQWIAERHAGGAEELRARLVRLDALFAWSTGMELPDLESGSSTELATRQAVGGPPEPTGSRLALEREWLARVLAGEGEGGRAQEIRAQLAQRNLLDGES